MSIIAKFIDVLTGGYITGLEQRIAALEDYIIQREVE